MTRRPAAGRTRPRRGDRSAGGSERVERQLSPDEVAQRVSSRPADARSKGDPFEEGITDDERAARLEGRKIYESGLNWGIVSEVMYRIDVFRRTVPRNNSAPLIQFYGPRAVRKWTVGEPKPKEWEQVDETATLRTVDFDPKLLRFKPVKEKPTAKKRGR